MLVPAGCLSEQALSLGCRCVRSWHASTDQITGRHVDSAEPSHSSMGGVCRLPVLFVDVNAVPSAVVYGAGIKVCEPSRFKQTRRGQCTAHGGARRTRSCLYACIIEPVPPG